MMGRTLMMARLLAAGAVFMTAGAASAQTMAPGQGIPPRPPMPGAPAQGVQPAGVAAQPLVPGSVVSQTRQQLNGDFGPMGRPRTSGQIQRAWDKVDVEKAVYTTELCDGCTYKVRLREYMVSVVELPAGEVIERIDVGDKDKFKIHQRGKSRIALQPVQHGIDTSMLVYGVSGRIYPFYLRAEGFNSKTVPDVVVRITGAVSVQADPAVVAASAGGPEDKPVFPALAEAVGGLTATSPATPGGDFVANAPFNPDSLRGWGEYKLWGTEELRPETVFRDDRFTYIRFGSKWTNIELPAAYVVVDGIDELVNTRVQGQTYIIESTRPLITLKSGMSFLCVQFTGKEA